MHINEENTYKGNPESGETNQQEFETPKSIEEQEQLNADTLSQRIGLSKRIVPMPTTRTRMRLLNSPLKGKKILADF